MYADETDGGSASFYTTGVWISNITTVTSSGLQSEEPSPWISVSPDHGDNAGDYTITITTERNTTGEDRTAVIRILCGDDEFIIDITQKGTKEDGTAL
ncbi:MAG: BACON domain-containing protein [Mangrovibacterium sp.]